MPTMKIEERLSKIWCIEMSSLFEINPWLCFYFVTDQPSLWNMKIDYLQINSVFQKDPLLQLFRLHFLNHIFCIPENIIPAYYNTFWTTNKTFWVPAHPYNHFHIGKYLKFWVYLYTCIIHTLVLYWKRLTIIRKKNWF